MLYSLRMPGRFHIETAIDFLCTYIWMCAHGNEENKHDFMLKWGELMIE